MSNINELRILRCEIMERLMQMDEETLIEVESAIRDIYIKRDYPPHSVSRVYREELQNDTGYEIIAAIKEYRKLTGIGLFEAKQKIRSWIDHKLLVY